MALSAAIGFARFGWTPLALHGIEGDGKSCTCRKAAKCASIGKHPIEPRWSSMDVPTGDELRAAWAYRPRCNVGIRTGTVSGIFVIDVDLPGVAAWDSLVDTHGGLPETTMVRTGSGGLHLYFAIPTGVSITNSNRGLPPGIDVRGEGGQVVAPPSITDRGNYVVVSGAPPAAPPSWLLDLLREPTDIPTPEPVLPEVDLDDAERARLWRYTEAAIEGELTRLDRLAAKTWSPGDAWDQSCFEVACRLLELANVPGAGQDRAANRERFLARAPRDGAWDDSPAKWAAALARIGARSAVVPDALPSLDELAGIDPRPTAAPTATTGTETPALDDAFEADLHFTRDVSNELHRLRVRQAAQDALRAEGEPPSPPFDAGTLGELLARPAEPPMRIEGLIPWESGTLVVAARKTGKTTFELNLVRSLLTGADFLGRFPVRPVTGSVAILNYEVSGHMLARWAHDHGIDPERLYLVNLRGRRNPLSHPGDRARLAADLRARGVETLIVDPFGRAYTGESQNDSGQVGSFLVDLDVFARGEVEARDLILSAHAGWNGERSRGASALEDWADVIVTLTRDPEDESLRFMKAEGRDVDVEEDRLDFAPTTRTLALAGTGSRRQAASTRHLEDLLPAVLDAVAASPGITGYGLDTVLREAGESFRKGEPAKAARLGVERGLLRIEDGPRNSRRFHTSPPRTSPPPPRGEVISPPPPPYRGEVGGEEVVNGLTSPTGEVKTCACGESISEMRTSYGKTECVDCEHRAREESA